ncbi:hypothetical protein UlMin_042312 [Ulmus minor]
MASFSSAHNSSTSSSPSSTTLGLTNSSSFPIGPSHGLSIKLDSNNFLLWKMQMENVIIAHGLEGFIDGTNQCPPQFLIQEGSTSLNPFYTTWQRLEELHSLLLTHEQRIKKVNSVEESSVMAANLASQQNNFNKFKNQGQIFNNQRPNYSSQNSTPTNQSYNYRNGAKRNNNGGNIPQCQVYGKMGHIAINCYHRFDKDNYKPTNPNSNSKMAAMIATPEMVTDGA